MLPNILVTSTARAAGFNTSNLSAPPSLAGTNGGRLKGKARKQAKKASSKPVATSTKYVIRIRDFTVLAEYILEKAIAVPLSFQSTLDRVIAARAGFGAQLDGEGFSVDPKVDAKHENFVDVLKHVRDILTSLMPFPDKDKSFNRGDTLQNRFAGLTVDEPSEAFLSAPNIQRPTKPAADPVDYAAEPPTSLEDAIFALRVLMNDMNKARASIRSVWEFFKVGGFDVVPAAVTTNTVVELVRNMIEDVLPLIEMHGGLKHCIQRCYMVNCLLNGFSVSEVTTGNVKDNFNYDTYDEANETYFMCFRLLEGFQGADKFHDDRALLVPVLTDLITIVLKVPTWPVHDELLRGMKELVQNGRIPFYMVFAAQVFLDVTYTLGPDIERGWRIFKGHTNFIVNDLEAYFEFHEKAKLQTWAPSNDQNIKLLREGILWLGKDPVYQILEEPLKRQGVQASKEDLHRIFRMSPVLCGLVLYQARFNYRQAGMAVADAWGSIQYAGHLYNALQSNGLLANRWKDMDLAKVILGMESFYAGGDEPRTLADQFRKYCLQMGVSAAALSKNWRKGRALASKAGPRGLKVNAPVATMFKERYGHDRDIVLTSEQVNRIIELSAFELETDEETGRTVLGQIGDETKLKEKQKLRHEIENGLKPSSRQPTKETRISLGQLTEMLANTLQAETIEFTFPYMTMHRWCWRLFRAVRDKCDSQLRQIIGPDYLENESQLTTLTGYIFMLACGAEGHVPNMGPMKAAAEALNGMLSAETGGYIVEDILKGALDERFQRLVALKVCVAHMSPRESENLSLLRDLPVANGDGANSVSGRGMIHTLLDTFHVIGPHGTHMCLVTEVTRCSVMQAKHNECHLWSDEELLEHCGEPALEKLQTFDDKPIPPGVPHIVTMPIWFPMERVNRLSLSDARIVLADFGETHRSLQESKFVSCAPEYCRPPEARFEPTRPKSFSSDIWTLACSVWGTLARTPLFSMYWPTEDAVTSLQVEALGKLPDEWWEKWDARSKYFAEDGQPIRTNSDPLRTLCSRFSDAMQEGRLRHKETMGFDERKALFAMLQSMLLYRPEQRCTIKEVLGSEWMIKYAMPDYERMCTGASDTVGGWKGTSSRLALIRPEMIPTERRISPPAF
ncbi:hypothetical protein ACQRIU_002411 [Beauveria bassiana]